MRGMIYKDLCLFFKGMDKVVLAVLGGLLVLLGYKSGVYAGMLFSFALDMMVGILHLTALEKEEKTAWRSYQRTMPVGVGKVMAGKYAALLLTVPVSVAGAVSSFPRSSQCSACPFTTGLEPRLPSLPASLWPSCCFTPSRILRTAGGPWRTWCP